MPLVMVVDDDQDLAEMLSIVLTGAGMEVDLVNRGDQVMDLFNSHTPDLVLLDVMLPGIDGIEACKIIHFKYFLQNRCKICNGFFIEGSCLFGLGLRQLRFMPDLKPVPPKMGLGMSRKATLLRQYR